MKKGMKVAKRYAMAAAVIATGLGSVQSAGAATTHTWTGAGSGSNLNDWSAKQNWSTSATPAAQDTALFKAVSGGASTTPDIDATGQVVGIITFDSAGTSFTISGSNSLSLDNSTSSAQINVLATDTSNQVISAPLSLASNLAVTNNSNALLTISGIISGTGKSLTKSGTGTVTLTGINTYTGGTTVGAGTLSLDTTGRLASTGNLTINGGTFVNAVNNAQVVNQFSMSSGGLKLTLSGDTAYGISASSGSISGGTITIAASGSQNLGKYTLVSGLVGGATGYGFSGVPAAYQVVTLGTEVDLQHKAVIGTVTATATDSTIIVGGSTAVSGTVANAAPTGSASLAFTAAGSGNVSGSGSNTAAATNSASYGGLSFTGNTVGANQSGTVTVSASGATNSPQTATVSVNVLGHSNQSFSTDTISGTYNVIKGTAVSRSVTLTNSTAGPNGSYIAGLALDSVTMLTGATAGDLVAAGGNKTLTANLSTGTAGLGQTQTFSVAMFDDHAYDGKGATSRGTQSYTATVNVFDHADAQLATGTFSPAYSNGSGDSNYTPVAPTQGLADGNHTLNIDFGTIWATPYDNPYPVFAYFDITNPLATAVTVALTGSPTGGATVTPGGTSPTWDLQAADGSTFNLTTLAAGGVYHARVLFNTNDPTLYLPGSPFKAAWDISLMEDSTVTGHSTTAQVLHVNAQAVAVPTPASALAGLGLLGGLGIKRFARSRRTKAEQSV